ncbi:sensor histidine kinase [Natrinema salaciae]|uniref:histidine kinase n=1 Tax=Natrinema salaciae TaxID=1186196 RepID=A0A1H8ZGU6_9EURY|nr:ATP-binding protein [Natrinema salaciae]SEP63467.1 His Kinase A (phospho-acceptor) domain-containing protein [Natrinema salaciae]
MVPRNRVTLPLGSNGAIEAIGGLYVVLAIGWAFERLVGGSPVSNVVLVASFIGVPGLVLLYGSHRLPRTEVRPEFYPTVVRWCLGGLGLLLGILVVYQLEPAESVTDPLRAVLVLTAFGSVAGFGVGINDALAKTRAHELDRRNRELRRIKARLEETNGELEASNERLEQFAYAASHDLQEPLRMVTSYLTLVETRYGDELDADGREFIDYAVEGAERMRTMIDALLEYSRVGTQGGSSEPVDLAAVFATVRKDLEVSLAESDATLETAALPCVEGDRNQLRQLFQNLVSNAIEYSGDEPPHVRVTAERSGSNWTVSVADEGIGIDPADADRVFEVFQRLHSREEYDGTGIGLALCKRIVERHGGEIRVESEPGGGSTFSVTLPATDACDE